MPRTLRSAPLVLLSLIAAAPPALGQGVSKWWPEVLEIESALASADWRKTAKRTEKLLRRVNEESWYDPELRRVLSRLAVARAVAEANLGTEDEAVWSWMLAQNLDRSVFSRDLSGYGRAPRLLLEHRLRQAGEAPPGLEVRRPPFLGTYEAPEDVEPEPFHFASRGASAQGALSLVLAEVIVDGEGRLRHPVVLNTEAHPILIFTFLDSLIRHRRIRPARLDGEPVAVFHRVAMRFKKGRW